MAVEDYSHRPLSEFPPPVSPNRSHTTQQPAEGDVVDASTISKLTALMVLLTRMFSSRDERRHRLCIQLDCRVETPCPALPIDQARTEIKSEAVKDKFVGMMSQEHVKSWSAISFQAERVFGLLKLFVTTPRSNTPRSRRFAGQDLDKPRRWHPLGRSNQCSRAIRLHWQPRSVARDWSVSGLKVVFPRGK